MATSYSEALLGAGYAFLVHPHSIYMQVWTSFDQLQILDPHKYRKPHRQECLCYMGKPGVRYNVLWLRETWRIPLPRPLKFHLHRLPRPALPGRDAPRPRFEL